MEVKIWEPSESSRLAGQRKKEEATKAGQYYYTPPLAQLAHKISSPFPTSRVSSKSIILQSFLFSSEISRSSFRFLKDEELVGEKQGVEREREKKKSARPHSYKHNTPLPAAHLLLAVTCLRLIGGIVDGVLTRERQVLHRAP